MIGKMQFPGCLTVLLPLLAAVAQAQPPVPSVWEGEASGAIRGRAFRIPVVVELKAPLPHEANPIHFSITTPSFKQVGDLLLASASEMGTGHTGRVYDAPRVGVYGYPVGRTAGRGNVTLQYFTVKLDGQRLTAVLTETQAAAAASLNSFVGPNVSAMEASELMRGVHEALGPTEIFAIGKGATVRLDFTPQGVAGLIEAKGRSVLNTSSDVGLQATLRARRVK